MNTVEFGQRLAKRIGQNDFASLGVDATQELVDGMNAALQTAYLLAPPPLRKRPIHLRLRAPVNYQAELTEGSVEITWPAQALTVIPSALPGRSIAIPGDPRLNRLLNSSELWFPQSGPTGTQTVTVLGDAAVLPFPIEALVTPPRLADDSYQLSPWPEVVEKIGWRETAVLHPTATRQSGQPQCYQLESLAYNLGAEPRQVLRVWPQPDREYALVCDVLAGPAKVTMEGMSVPSVLPWDMQFAESILLPLAAAELLHSEIFRRDARTAQAQAQAALGRLQLLSNTPDPRDKRIGTPDGW